MCTRQSESRIRFAGRGCSNQGPCQIAGGSPSSRSPFASNMACGTRVRMVGVIVGISGCHGGQLEGPEELTLGTRGSKHLEED